MKTYTCRCKHCKTTYSYQASGEGCLSEINDKDYCPQCKQIIINALKSIPIKFGYEYVETDEVTIEELTSFENNLNSQLRFKRVTHPKIDIENNLIGYWNYINYKDKKYATLSWFPYKYEELKPRPLPPPMGKIFFLDILKSKTDEDGFEETKVEQQKTENINIDDEIEKINEKYKVKEKREPPIKIQIFVCMEKNLLTNEFVGYYEDYN